MYHKPILIEESILGLNIKPSGVYVDATFGGGGHSKEILKHLDSKGKLIGIDQDKDSKVNIIDDKRFKFVYGNFRYIKNYLKYLKIESVDGIIADLGVSSHQFNEGDRGFSFRFGGNIDMRMNNSQSVSAEHVINNYTEEELTNIFKNYSDIKNPRKISKLIIEGRSDFYIDSIEKFQKIISSAIPAHKEIKYLAQVFQAIRIEVNDEINSLKEFLISCADILKPGGRLAVISYHSIEDKLVKNIIKTGNIKGETITDIYGHQDLLFTAVNKNVIVPSQKEIDENSRSKSAKLRIAEKNER